MREFSCKVSRAVLIPELNVSIRVLESQGDRVRLALAVPARLRIVRRQSPLCRAVGVVRRVR
jgi:sRNA-binding carbon storage regulator CsrA